jgi:hypothetical protein
MSHLSLALLVLVAPALGAQELSGSPLLDAPGRGYHEQKEQLAPATQSGLRKENRLKVSKPVVVSEVGDSTRLVLPAPLQPAPPKSLPF